MELFNSLQKPDADAESQCFHLVEHYQSVNESFETDRGDRVKASKYFQRPQQSEFSIKIGSFEEPKVDYLSDPIQSFYKQFVSSEEGIYFFKYEDKTEKQLEDSVNPPKKPTPLHASQPQNIHLPSAGLSGASGKTGIESQSDAFSNQ